LNFFPTEQFTDSLPHFRGGIESVGKGHNLAGLRVALADEARNAIHQDRCLPGPRAGHHEHGPMHMLDGLALAIIGNKRRRARSGLQNRHWRQNTTCKDEEKDD
jgi:hypothetical protein